MINDVFLGLTEEACRGIFYAIRWPSGERCIKCNHWQKKIYREHQMNRYRYYCPECKIWWNDFTGTIFEKRRLSLRQWFMAIYMLLEQKETASAIARELNINRHTAESIVRLIRKEEQWCRLILNKIAAATPKNVVSLMPLSVAENTLGVSRRTIYRLIAEGSLSAIKVGSRWRFRAEDIRKYINSKISRYGTTATGKYCYFRPAVLDKYIKNKTKYYLQEEAYQGWVGNKQDYQQAQNGLKRKLHPDILWFANLRYRKVITPDGHSALAIEHKDYQGLPKEEYIYWSGFIIPDRPGKNR
jgi:excisionase family DNA binding protein